MSEKLKVAVIVASTREGRFAEKPSNWIVSELKKHEAIDPELLDLRDYPLPFFREPLSPSDMKEPYSSEPMAAWQQKIASMDAFIIVTPEYNHGYPAELKNALDYLSKEWHRKPVAFISYGTVGGARSVQQLRQVVIDLRMAPLAAAVHILGEPLAKLKNAPMLVPAELFEPYAQRATKLITEILWWGNALKNARKE
jgi:NAD(P)H-dependent FMN reductase